MKRPLVKILLLMRPYSGAVALSMLLGIATIASSVGLMSTSAYIISLAALHPVEATLNVAVVGVRFFGIARAIFRYLERYVSHNTTFRILARIRTWFYSTLEPLAPARLLYYRSGDLLSRIVADIDTLQYFFIRVVAPILVAIAMTLATWIFLLFFSFQVATTVAGLMLLGGVGLPLLSIALTSKPSRQLVEVRAKLYANVIDSVQGMSEIIALGAEHRQQAVVAALSEKMTELQRRIGIMNGLTNALMTMLTNIAVIAVLFVAVPLVVSGHLQGVLLAVLALAAMASFEAVSALPTAIQQMQSSDAAAVRLYEITDAQPAVHSPEHPQSVWQDASIHFEHVVFHYAESEPDVLQDVTFTVPEGANVALVGPSGSGKSTIAHLLLRFWEYSGGTISIGGHTIQSYDPDDVRAHISIVSQETYLLNTTIRQNILLACNDATEDELVTAAKRAHIHDMIMALPQGYNTMVGEQGLLLSSGERQRIAIARAILKNAPILVLDEATASLDTVTEQSVMLAIREAMRGRTTLYITHRLIDMEMADTILVIADGRIVEQGTHAELMQHNGLYRSMYETQHDLLPITVQ